MWLECTCEDINQAKWDELMKGARPYSYKTLVRKIKKELPSLYRKLSLDLYNPWENDTYQTKTHYILTWSAIEFFINKGENPYQEEDLYENMKKVITLTENDLKEIVENSIKKILSEKKKGIHIKKKNEGKFTATQKKTGKSTEELCHSKNPLTRKRANFAKMAKRHWKPLK